MIKVTYDPVNGHVWPDGQLQQVIQQYVNRHKTAPSEVIDVVTGSEIAIHEFRCAVATKTITPNEIELWFNGSQLEMNQDARLNNWPTGFCDIYDRQLTTLLDAQVKGGI